MWVGPSGWAAPDKKLSFAWWEQTSTPPRMLTCQSGQKKSFTVPYVIRWPEVECVQNESKVKHETLKQVKPGHPRPTDHIPKLQAQSECNKEHLC